MLLQIGGGSGGREGGVAAGLALGLVTALRGGWGVPAGARHPTQRSSTIFWAHPAINIPLCCPLRISPLTEKHGYRRGFSTTAPSPPRGHSHRTSTQVVMDEKKAAMPHRLAPATNTDAASRTCVGGRRSHGKTCGYGGRWRWRVCRKEDGYGKRHWCRLPAGRARGA
jgi:hypothetical protein